MEAKNSTTYQVRDEGNRNRGTLEMNLREAFAVHYQLNDGPLKLDPDPKTVDPQTEGWIPVSYCSDPPLQTTVEVWGLSELNETAYIDVPNEESDKSSIVDRSDEDFNRRYCFFTDEKKTHYWNPKYVTHWRMPREK